MQAATAEIALSNQMIVPDFISLAKLYFSVKSKNLSELLCKIIINISNADTRELANMRFNVIFTLCLCASRQVPYGRFALI